MCCGVTPMRVAWLPCTFLSLLFCGPSKAQAPRSGAPPASRYSVWAWAQRPVQILAPADAAPTINTGGAVNAASYAAGAPLAPGSIVAVFGSFLLGEPSQSSDLPLPTDLSGLSVQFGGVAAPLFYASSGQVNVQVPWEMATQTTGPVSASLNGQAGAAQTVQFAPFSPGIFTVNDRGTGQGAILDGISNRMVDGSNPAVPGATILEIFCTGLGGVTIQQSTGIPAPVSPLPETTTTPAVTVGGLPAKVLFSGLAPGYVGEYQVNALMPAAVFAGVAVPVGISIGGTSSNTATIAVQGLSPSYATVGSGPVTVAIYGRGFTDKSSVTYNGAQQPVTFVNETELAFALSGAELATVGTYAVVVTTPGGGSMPLSFTVNSAAFSLGGRSVSIDARVTIGNQVLWSEIGALATGGNVYSIGMDDQSASPAYPQFKIAFASTAVNTGSSVTFSSQSLGNESGSGAYRPDPAAPSGSVAAASLTITFGVLAAGAPVSGAFTLVTAQGTVNGNFTGAIISVE